MSKPSYSMKNLPLFMQIWLVFASITLGISILLAVLFPATLRDFFTKEIYANIESAQSSLLVNEEPFRNFNLDIVQGRRQHIQNIRTVNHMFFLENGQVVSATRILLPMEILVKIREQLGMQHHTSIRYSSQIEDRKIFYVIHKGSIGQQEIALVSFMWDSYRDDLVQTLFNRLLLIMGLVFLLSWIPSILLARYLSKPLTMLEGHVKQIANRHWHNPIALERKDEIGKLGESIELLREQIIRQDEAQQTLLQHASHELKTPVMVIRSYAQSIIDGIYPKGNLEGTVQVIEEEAERLEKQIRDLLYLTKLDYLATHENKYTEFDFTQLLEEVIERLRWQRSELDWEVDCTPIRVQGDKEQWKVALENILDNQIRYAEQKIIVILKEDTNNELLLTIWNDGPHIEDHVMERLFHQFTKGYKGEFGLGLAITQRIATLHGAEIWAGNENAGVSFTIRIKR